MATLRKAAGHYQFCCRGVDGQSKLGPACRAFGVPRSRGGGVARHLESHFPERPEQVQFVTIVSRSLRGHAPRKSLARFNLGSSLSAVLKRTGGNGPAAIPQLFQQLYFLGKRQRGQTATHGALAFQNSSHPLAHELPLRNLSQNRSHFSTNPWRTRRASSLSGRGLATVPGYVQGEDRLRVPVVERSESRVHAAEASQGTSSRITLSAPSKSSW
jgi:hypothetical protein